MGEIPRIRNSRSPHNPECISILGVSLYFDERASFEGWLARNDIGWPKTWDGKGFSTPLAKRYKVHGIPFTILIDRDGKVSDVELRGDALLARIGALLESPAASSAEPESSTH